MRSPAFFIPFIFIRKLVLTIISFNLMIFKKVLVWIFIMLSHIHSPLVHDYFTNVTLNARKVPVHLKLSSHIHIAIIKPLHNSCAEASFSSFFFHSIFDCFLALLETFNSISRLPASKPLGKIIQTNQTVIILYLSLLQHYFNTSIPFTIDFLNFISAQIATVVNIQHLKTEGVSSLMAINFFYVAFVFCVIHITINHLTFLRFDFRKQTFLSFQIKRKSRTLNLIMT